MIDELKKSLEEEKEKYSELKIKVDKQKYTLNRYQIKGLLEDDMEKAGFYKKFELVFHHKKSSSRLLSFLCPSELNSLSLTSKIMFSIIRTTPNLIS